MIDGDGVAMSTDNPSGEKAAQSSSSITVAQDRSFLIWGGYVCGALAFIFWPIILGPAGIIIGVVNLRRGEKRHGQQQVGLGALGLVVGLVIGALVNGGFGP